MTVTPTPTPKVTVTPSPTATEAPASATGSSSGLGPWGWVLLVALVAGLVGAFLFWRSSKRSSWDVDAGALALDTQAATGTRLPSMLTATTAAQRALSWPPLRAALVDLVQRWDALTDRAPDDSRKGRSIQIAGLLREVTAAVDAENEALATGRDWMLLRPRLDEATRALVRGPVAARATRAGHGRGAPPADVGLLKEEPTARRAACGLT